MDLGLSNKRVLITGGSRGIGKCVARQMLAEGARVAMAARDAPRLAEAKKELGQYGGEVHDFVVDTSSDEQVRQMVGDALEALGDIDILVNGAAEPGGFAPSPRFGEVTKDVLLSEVNVKVMGYLRVAQLVAPSMIKNRWGRIINISGLAARQSGSIVGSIRNVAVAAMTKNLADELGQYGINVTVVHPGATRTERTSEEQLTRGANNLIGRLVEAEEVASVITFLASERSIAITGDAIPVGGGVRGSIYY